LLGALLADLREVLTSVELTTLTTGAGTSFLQFTFGVKVASLRTVDMVAELITCDLQDGGLLAGKKQGWSAVLVGELVSRLGASLASESTSTGEESLVLKVPYGALKVERATRESLVQQASVIDSDMMIVDPELVKLEIKEEESMIIKREPSFEFEDDE